MAIRRVLLVPLNHDHAQRGVASAFSSLFPEVAEYDYLARKREGVSREEINEEFFRVATHQKPDWIWLQLQNTGILQAETIHRIRKECPRCVISHWMGDCQAVVSSYVSSICTSTHLTLLSSIGQIPLYRHAGAELVEYCQVAVDWHEDVLGEPTWEPPFQIPEVVFCGNYYGSTFPGTGDRADAVKALWGAGIQVGIVGVGWPQDFPVVGRSGVKQQIHVYRRAKVALSINNFNTIDRYYSDRQLIAMASGTPVVCRYVPGLEQEFENGRDCLWYQDTSVLVSHVRRLLASPEERLQIGAAGRSCVQRAHTWWHRILQILPNIEALSDRL